MYERARPDAGGESDAGLAQPVRLATTLLSVSGLLVHRGNVDAGAQRGHRRGVIRRAAVLLDQGRVHHAETLDQVRPDGVERPRSELGGGQRQLGELVTNRGVKRNRSPSCAYGANRTARTSGYLPSRTIRDRANSTLRCPLSIAMGLRSALYATSAGKGRSFQGIESDSTT